MASQDRSKDERWISVAIEQPGGPEDDQGNQHPWAGHTVATIVRFCTGKDTPWPPANGATLNGAQVDPSSPEILKPGDVLVISIPSESAIHNHIGAIV